MAYYLIVCLHRELVRNGNEVDLIINRAVFEELKNEGIN